MPSLDQGATVKQLLSEGWTITPPTDTPLLGAPIAMTRTRADGTVDKIVVLPNGDATPNAQP